MANNYQSQVDSAYKALDTIENKVKALDIELLKVIASLNKVNDLKTPSDVSNGIKNQSAEIEKLNALLVKQQAQIDKLTQAKKRLNTLSLSEKDTRQKSIAQLKLQVTSNNKLASSYERLIAQKKRMKAELDRLTTSYGKNSAQAIRMQASYDKVVNKSNKANSAFISLSKGGIRGAVGGIKSLIGAFGVFGGATVIASLIPNIFELTKKFDALRFSMSKTIPDMVEYSDTQLFLDEITQQYGVDLLTTTERYIKFDAAARQSNLGLKETQEIFGSVTKAAGVLGLKTDELSGVYLALEQMLSKGKVTTEELRRQLGERLPGAFGIMADALNVSVSQLDKMLKKGEILSAQALPKFAKELEKAYGIQSVNKIETLQAAQARLSNEWAMFVRDISGDDTIIQNTFKGVLNFMSNLLEGIKDVGNEIDEAFKDEAVKAFEKSQNSFLQLQKKQVDGLNSFETAQERVNEAIRLRFALEDNLATNIFENQKKVLGAENAREENAKAEAKSIVERMKGYTDYSDFIEDLGLREDIFEKNRIATIFARIKGIDSVLEKSQAELDLEKDINDEVDKGKNKKRDKVVSVIPKDFTKETESFRKEIEKQIKVLEEALDLYPETSREYISISQSLKDLNRALEGIDVSGAFDEIDLGIEKSKELNIQLKESADALRDYFKGFQDDFFSDVGFDSLNEMFLTFDEKGLSMFDKLYDAADTTQEKFAVTFNAIAEVAQEAFNFISQNQTAMFDAQYDRLEKEKETALLFAGESDAAKEQIEEQAERRKIAIQKREAQMSKKLAIANTVINTAQAVVGALAPPPTGAGAIAGIPLAAIIGGLGAAQVALIASTSVPEFFRGTMNAPEGLALVDEKQPEVHTDRQGRVKSWGSEQGANYRHLEAGDKIFKSREMYFEKELGSVLSGNDILPYGDFMSVPNVVVDNSGIKPSEMDAIIGKHFANIQTNETVIDKQGLRTFVKNQGGKTEILNNRTTFKGYSV